MELSNVKSVNDNNKLEINDKFLNFDAEIAVIGCLLWDNRSYEKIADFLTPDHFDQCSKIYFCLDDQPEIQISNLL